MPAQVLRLTYDLPVEQAGFAQAALIHLGGIAVQIGLITDLPTYQKNVPQLPAPKRKARGRESKIMSVIRRAVDTELATTDTITAKRMQELLSRKRASIAMISYFFQREIETGRMTRVSRGEYRRVQS